MSVASLNLAPLQDQQALFERGAIGGEVIHNTAFSWVQNQLMDAETGN